MGNRNYADLNVNPCKTCAPLGGIMAFKGIEKTMSILHGSQGCSTYIRRHMAGHFNEPVDIASSSLNEKGTVYGGEANLLKSIDNVKKLYSPKLIGINTTCLAETIGEDLERIINIYNEKNPDNDTLLVPVYTAGYSGNCEDGYYSALYSIAKKLATNNKKHTGINIICGMMSPGDVRNIKRILSFFDINYTLLPDISDTLDAPYSKTFSKIPVGGTRIDDIFEMGGAAATIEMGLIIEQKKSPGMLLMEKFGVPLYKSPVPIGLQNTDKFIELLCLITGKKLPEPLKIERGRLLDAMIDSHKHNGEGRAAIIAEPELLLSLNSICLENGIKPVLLATGSDLPLNVNMDGFFAKDSTFLPDSDFDRVLSLCSQLKVNVAIGSSDAKVLTERKGIPLIRIGFPIHDRVGGQREVSTGYNGTVTLLDKITNTLIENKFSTYKAEAKKYIFKYKNTDNEKTGAKNKIGMDLRTAEHPCFTKGACTYARMHMPIAPKCNLSCNYCNRKYDCANESRPGVTSKVLSPEEALEKFLKVKKALPNLKVIGIAGPGDALADFENTSNTLKLIREVDPDITFCLSTNGLLLPYYAEKIKDLGVSHVTVTINSVDLEISEKIYSGISLFGSPLKGRAAYEVLLSNQLLGLKLMKDLGIVCKVNIVVIPGINDKHVEEVVKTVKEYGVFITNIVPLIPAAGSKFESKTAPGEELIDSLRKKCSVYVKQMTHCKQCRADAIGTLAEEKLSQICPPKQSFKIAVASKNGVYVDTHFGHAEVFYIYSYGDGKLNFLEKRFTSRYCNGSDDCNESDKKKQRFAKLFGDCKAVIVKRIGLEPRKELESLGLQVYEKLGPIEDSVANICSTSLINV